MESMESRFENDKLPLTSWKSGTVYDLTEDLHAFTNQIVNLFLVGSPGQWVLVDAGMPGSHEAILGMAEGIYGKDARPDAIILTHGHFDHVGSILHLVRHWEVPVYAHESEHPYLNGTKDYPPPDPSVEGGLVTELSRVFPHAGINLGNHLFPLPADGQVPGMSGWRWIHTPGHSPGHVSLFRESDRSLIAGDAFVTVKQESVYHVVTQRKEIHGPPRYFTTDWQSAWESVKRLNELRPARAVTGHGQPMEGAELSEGLERLAREFREVAIPDYGRYV